MIALKNEMIQILENLKKNFAAISVKADFEAEGTTIEELIFLKQIIDCVGLNLTIKIGGCEALFDLKQAQLFNANEIMVPVIETEFALKKFFSAIKRTFGTLSDVNFILNAETKTCAENFNEILKFGSNFLKAVTIGRVDLAASLNLNRTQIDSNLIFEFCLNFFNLAKHYGLKVGLGGGLCVDSFKFLQKIKFDRFETRKIIFKNTNKNNEINFKKSIFLATKFELCCLEFKNKFFNKIAIEDELRLDLLKKRIQQF